MDIKINPVEKELWCAALEIGDLRQARGSLHDLDTDGYCCLGVYAKVKGCTFEHRELDVDDDDDYGEGVPTVQLDDEATVTALDGTEVNMNETLEPTWAEATAGLTEEHQNLLTHLNDGGEMGLHGDHPMIDVAKELCTSSCVRVDDGRTIFKFRKHSFAEISAAIRKYF